MTVCGQDSYQSDKKIFLLSFAFSSVIRMQMIYTMMPRTHVAPVYTPVWALLSVFIF